MTLRAPRFAIDLAVAFQFLTRLPLPKFDWAPDGLARAIKYFPLIGAVIGLGAEAVEKALAPHLSLYRTSLASYARALIPP